MKPALRAALLCAILLAAAAGRVCALLTISAETDRTSVEINGNLQLTVQVAGDSASVPEPQVPAMQNFNIYSSGRSQSISIINGKITTSVAYNYILTPRFLGVQKIPSITVFNGREKAASPEIEITVTKAAPAQPQASQQQRLSRQSRAAAAKQAKAGDQIFLKAETDKKSAYPGEQVSLSIKFFTSVPLSSNPQYMQPVYKNLIPEDLPPVRNGETEVNGVRFAYSEIKSALFALSPGKADIGPASVAVQIPSNEPLDPFDPNFFNKFMSMNAGQGATREFSTEQIQLDIKPLPGGAPASFSGAVGNYSISASLDKAGAREGEAVNFSVTVSGTGNIKAISPPKLPEMGDFKVFDTLSSLDISKKGDRIEGKKIFTYLLVPRSSGRKTLPAVPFSFFDPASGKYREVMSDPVSVNVEKNAQAARNLNFNSTAGGGRVTASGSDIRYVSPKAKAGLLSDSVDGINSLPAWLHLLPCVLLLSTLWLSRFNKFKSANPLLFRFRQAKSEAAKDLEEIEARLKAGKVKEAMALLYDSFLDYLSDKCGVKVAALTIRKAGETIRARFPAAGAEEIEDVKALWSTLELCHYSPAGCSDPEEVRELARRYSALLSKLERKLK